MFKKCRKTHYSLICQLSIFAHQSFHQLKLFLTFLQRMTVPQEIEGNIWTACCNSLQSGRLPQGHAAHPSSNKYRARSNWEPSEYLNKCLRIENIAFVKVYLSQFTHSKREACCEVTKFHLHCSRTVELLYKSDPRTTLSLVWRPLWDY